MRLDPHPQPREAGGCLLDSKHGNRSDTFPSLGEDHISGLSFPTRPRTRLVSLDAARSQERLALLFPLTNQQCDLELLLTAYTQLHSPTQNAGNSTCFANAFGVF